MPPKQRRKTSPLPPNLMSRLRKLVETHGEGGALRLLGMPRHSLARCLSGLTVLNGTASHVQRLLERIDEQLAAV